MRVVNKPVKFARSTGASITSAATGNGRRRQRISACRRQRRHGDSEGVRTVA